MVLYPDADLEDADWPKANTWDLEPDPEWWERHATEEDIRRTAELPAFTAAPPAVRAAIADRLADLAD
jgi:hypothetical protein